MSDLIDRQLALDAIDSWRREYPLDLQEPIDDCWNSIRELPAVQPDLSGYSDRLWKSAYERGKAEPQAKRKQGEWINEGRIIRCNKCKIGYAVVKGMKSAITYNFCPSCGADMRGGDSR